MMNEQLSYLRGLVAQDNNYETSLNSVLSILTSPDYEVKRDRGILICDVLEDVFSQNKWGRRKAVGFVEHIFNALNKAKKNTDVTNDDLDNFMTGLKGYCTIDGFSRFMNDPSDADLFKDYVLSEKWLDEDFYTGTL